MGGPIRLIKFRHRVFALDLAAEEIGKPGLVAHGLRYGGVTGDLASSFGQGGATDARHATAKMTLLGSLSITKAGIVHFLVLTS